MKYKYSNGIYDTDSDYWHFAMMGFAEVEAIIDKYPTLLDEMHGRGIVAKIDGKKLMIISGYIIELPHMTSPWWKSVVFGVGTEIQNADISMGTIHSTSITNCTIRGGNFRAYKKHGYSMFSDSIFTKGNTAKLGTMKTALGYEMYKCEFNDCPDLSGHVARTIPVFNCHINSGSYVPSKKTPMSSRGSGLYAGEYNGILKFLGCTFNTNNPIVIKSCIIICAEVPLPTVSKNSNFIVQDSTIRLIGDVNGGTFIRTNICPDFGNSTIARIDDTSKTNSAVIKRSLFKSGIFDGTGESITDKDEKDMYNRFTIRETGWFMGMTFVGGTFKGGNWHFGINDITEAVHEAYPSARLLPQIIKDGAEYITASGDSAGLEEHEYRSSVLDANVGVIMGEGGHPMDDIFQMCSNAPIGVYGKAVVNAISELHGSGIRVLHKFQMLMGQGKTTTGNLKLRIQIAKILRPMMDDYIKSHTKGGSE